VQIKPGNEVNDGDDIDPGSDDPVSPTEAEWPLERYFGRTFGSPPGPPGGGMTGVLPPPGGGVTISGSAVPGGQMTPSERDNLSLRFPLP